MKTPKGPPAFPPGGDPLLTAHVNIRPYGNGKVVRLSFLSQDIHHLFGFDQFKVQNGVYNVG